MSSYDTITQTFEGVAATAYSCWCGIQFAVPESLYKHYRRQNDERPGSYSLYCPLGHPMIPTGRSEADKLRDALALERQRLNQARATAETARRSAAAARGVVTKIKKRISKGVCPCCRQQFADLHRHMAGQHPEWTGAEHTDG